MPNGKVHLKTDDDFLYDYAMKFLQKQKVEITFHSDDLYSHNNIDEIKSIKTRYERYYLKHGRIIKYIEFVLD